MRRRCAVMVCSLLALAASLAAFQWLREKSYAPVPVPSEEAGYYDDAFVLTLAAPEGGTIYYTTDGSLPTSHSSVYTGGILIEDRSQEPNVYNAVQNVVPDWKDYTPDPDPVDKGTVIRAVYVNAWGISSDVLTQTYFVGLRQPEQGYTLSLVFEYDDLFGDDGIYVTGKAYDDWYLAGGPSSQAPIPNFEQDLEVGVVAELMDDSGDIMNQAIGLSLQGATARAEARKRFTMTAREEYSGAQTFDIELYSGVASHSVMLKYYLPDALAASLVGDRSVAVQESVPVRVYLNGEFLYNSFMLERYDKQYFRQHYQVDDRQIIKNGIADEDAEGSTLQYEYDEHLYWVRNTDFTDETQWTQLQKEADIQSYIDFIAINYFFCNIDFCDDHNYVLWRSPTDGDSPYEDRRWRWCVYDIDALEWVSNSISGDPASINAFSYGSSQERSNMRISDGSLYRALRSNPAFCQQFVLSFMDILNNNFTPERVERVLQEYGYTLDWLDGYFRKRPAYAVLHLAEEFGLTGTLETVQISVEDPQMGTVTVNTTQIDLSDGTWTGQYFTDYPITVTADASDGYQFLGWKGGARDRTEPTITCHVDGGLTLEPIFAELP